MDTLLSSFSPSATEYSFVPSPEIDLSSLFEQCGIPLADLHAQIVPSTPITKNSNATWYEGTAPAEEDVVELEDDHLPVGGQLSKCTAKMDLLDGLGKDSVSTPSKGLVSLNSTPLCRQHDGDNARQIQSQEAEGGQLTSPTTTARGLSGQTEDSISQSPITSPAPVHPSQSSLTPFITDKRQRSDKTRVSEPSSQKDPMDFYSQQHFFAGQQLSSPVSIDSSPDRPDSYLYTPEFSPHFVSSEINDMMANGVTIQSEAMRRTQSTPFSGQYSQDNAILTPENIYGLSHLPKYTDFSSGPDQQEFVPASDHSQWLNNGDYLLQQPDQHSAAANTNVMPMNAPRPAMKRKNRPIPIATSMPRYPGSVGVQTAPLERRDLLRQGMQKSPLSAKRSFEDFSDLTGDLPDVPPYRHVATPSSKRARSSQGFKHSIPASPFMDEPLFSPEYNSNGNNDLALAMDPERFLLSSPPYSQVDFCSSPNYLMQSTPSSIDSYSVPTSMLSHPEQMLGYQPLSPLDIDGVWAQKPVFSRPAQIVSQPVYTTPRGLAFGAVSPSRKTVPKARKPPVARAISFCNYTAADRKTILSGVAPSGSNKKALTKMQDMTRSQSQGAMTAV